MRRVEEEAWEGQMGGRVGVDLAFEREVSF